MMAGRPRKTFEQRCDEFWQRVDRGNGSIAACWIWTGPRNPRSGYGSYSLDCRTLHAHRFAWMSVHGRHSLDGGVIVRHKCDNPPCVNPAHLESGTQADNMRDKMDRGRGRWLQGEAMPRAKLDADKVRTIRRLYSGDATIGELADSYGVSRTTVARVVEGRGWKHVR